MICRLSNPKENMDQYRLAVKAWQRFLNRRETGDYSWGDALVTRVFINRAKSFDYFKKTFSENDYDVFSLLRTVGVAVPTGSLYSPPTS